MGSHRDRCRSGECIDTAAPIEECLLWGRVGLFERCLRGGGSASAEPLVVCGRPGSGDWVEAMQRLAGLDSSFVYLENEATPMQVATTCVFDPSTAAGGYSFARVRRVVEDRLHLLVPFRRRLVEMPGRIHRPVWVDDPDFDLDQHLHRDALPSPGGPVELEDFTAAVISRRLHRCRPLWDMHLVEGLEGGRVAAVTTLHHAAIDGVSGAELTATLLDLGPEPAAVAPPASAWMPDPIPTGLVLARGAVRDLLHQPVAAASVLARSASAALRLYHHNRRPDTTPPPGPFAAPRLWTNAPLTDRRHITFTQMDLDDVKAIKNTTGVTINDVVLALCAGALRDHLEDHGGLPQQSLVAAVPVSVRTEDQRGTMGNRLSVMLVDLATTIDDPVARLRAIAASTRAAKTQHQVLGADTLSELASLTPPALLAAIGGLESRLNLLARIPPLCNVIVSNFPGPAIPLYCAGMRMIGAYPMGPLGVGTGLNITVQTYLDTLWFGVVACPDTIPEPGKLAGRLTDARHDLTQPLTNPTRPTSPRTVKTHV
jgi:diacylglycerol O-acyltransferase / wax synthase